MNKDNPKTQYELLVKNYLKENIFDQSFKFKPYHRKKYKGKSGVSHEFDISFEVNFGLMDLLIVVECKELKKKATKQDMEIFASRINEVSAHKGIFVTTNGFQDSAKRIANSNKIALHIAKDGVYTPESGGPHLPLDKDILIMNFPFLKDVDEKYISGIINNYNPCQHQIEFGANHFNKVQNGFVFKQHEFIINDKEKLLFDLQTTLLLTILELRTMTSIKDEK